MPDAREKKAARVTWELRANEDGTPDEVLLYVEGTCVMHIEQMHDNHWWMGLYKPRSKRHDGVHINFWGKSKVRCRVEPEGWFPTPGRLVERQAVKKKR